MTNDLKGKSAIVTGAGKGIGRAIAVELARNGVNVALVSRTRADLDSLAKEIERSGARALAIPGDVSVERDVASAVDAAAQSFGGIDILVNNAGIGSFAPAAELAVADFDRMWQVNMRGVFLFTQAVLPHMTNRTSGDILNLASLAGRNAFIGGSGYCATKWALIGYARCLMLEVREHNIRVVTLCPGSVATDFGDHAASKNSPAIPRAEDIAAVALSTLRMPRHVMVSEVDIRPTNPKG